MSHSKNDCCSTIETIQRYMAAISEINRPFPKHRIHVFNGTSCLRLVCEYFHACPYCFDGTSGWIFIFYDKEAIKSLHVSQSWRRPN